MRLNLGSGGQYAPGWWNIDRAGEVDLLLDLTNPLPFDDESASGVVLHHVLDLLDCSEGHALLVEILRVLQPGAVLRISLADIGQAIREAMRGNREWFDGLVPDSALMMDTLGEYVLQRGARRTYWSAHRLLSALRAAGYVRQSLVSFGTTTGPGWITDLDSRERESWFVEGTA